MSGQVHTAVTPDWHADHLNRPGLKIITSESMTVAATASSQAATARDVRAEFEAAYIPGVALLNLDEISDPDTALLMMLASQDQLSTQVGALGITNDDLVVVCDSQSVRTSPRAWWMFRVFALENVAVLDGGFPKWRLGS